MNAQKLVSNGINYAKYKKQYGTMLDPQVLDFVIALNFIDGVVVPREDALNFSRENAKYKAGAVWTHRLLNWCIRYLNETYPDIPAIPELKFNYMIRRNFVVRELVFRDIVQEEDVKCIETALANYEFLEKKEGFRKLSLGLCYYSDVVLGYLGMGLNESELKDVIDTVYESITFANKKEMDQMFIWHLIELLEPASGLKG